MLRINKRNTDENKKHRSFKNLVEKRRQSFMSSQSTSVSSTEDEVIDSDTFSDFEFSFDSRSPYSSRENSPSGVYTSWNMHRPYHQNEHRSVKDFEIPKGKVTKVGDTTEKGWQKLAENSFGLTVLGCGTRLMRDIFFPTVIIQMPKKWLHTSMLYYIVLEPASDSYVGDIPCLLFTSPKGIKKDAQTAELLPLRMVTSSTSSSAVSLSPLLLHVADRCIFREGCTFKVKAIESGRCVDRKQRRWEHYDLDHWEMMHDLLRRLLLLDISQMPKYMLRQLTPLRVAEQVTNNTTGRRTKSFICFLLNKRRQVGVPVLKLSCLHPNLRLYGLSTRGGSSFADWFKAVPPDTHVDKDFACDWNTKLSKDTFKNSWEFDEYLNISDIV